MTLNSSGGAEMASPYLSNLPKWVGKFLLILSIFLLPIVVNAATDGSAEIDPFTVTDFESGSRGYNAISIHPDDRLWLISECTNRIDSKRFGCYLFLYSRGTRVYQRFDLPLGYDYSDAKFSPSGRWIVAVRTPVARNTSRDEMARSLSDGEILVMRSDGTDLRILPLPKGRIKAPAISPDESKVAYWVAGRIRPAGAKTTFMDFDVHEFDIASKADVLFAGPYRFFLARSLQYKGHDEIVANAYGPAAYVSEMGKYRDKFGSSEIFLFHRGAREFPAPAFSTIASATYPSIDQYGRIYLQGAPHPHGMSIVEVNSEKVTRRWPVPPLAEQGLASMAVSPDGSYIVFVYPTTSPRSPHPKNGLGIFDLSAERWIPMSLPQPESAIPFPVQDKEPVSSGR